jgi:hypothetical protein
LIVSIDALRRRGTVVAKRAAEVTRVATPVAIALAAAGAAALAFFMVRLVAPPAALPRGHVPRGRYARPLLGTLAQVAVTVAAAGASYLLRRAATRFLETRSSPRH